MPRKTPQAIAPLPEGHYPRGRLSIYNHASANWLPALLILAMAGGLFAVVLGLQHKGGDRSGGPSPTIVALANSYKRLYELAADPVWSPDGTMLAAMGASKTRGDNAAVVTILDAATGQQIKAFDTVTATHSLGWSPDSRMLVATTSTSTLYLLDVTSGTVAHTLTIPLPPNFPTESPRTHLPFKYFYFFTDSFGWSSTTHHLIVAANVGASSGIRKPNSGEIADVMGYYTVQEWDPSTGKLLRSTTLPDRSGPTTISPDGDAFAVAQMQLITATQTPLITWEIWSVAQGALTARVNTHIADPNWNAYRTITWSPDSSRFAEVVNERAIAIVDRTSGQVQRTLPDHLLPTYTPVPYVTAPIEVPTAPPPPPLYGQPPFMLNTALAGMPAPIPSVEPPPTNTVGPTDTPIPTPTIDVNWVQSVTAVAWSPDSKTLAAFYGDVLRLWDPATGQTKWITRWFPSYKYIGGYPAPEELAWSSDGRMLVLHVLAAPLQLIDAGTGLPVRDFPEDVSHFEWAPKGPMLLLKMSNSASTEIWGPVPAGKK